jgi:putative endonuclease
MRISSITSTRLRIFESSLHALDRLAARMGRSAPTAPHLATGMRGEQIAYFHLRRLGYTVVARRWRSARLRGDVDLIAWDGDWLCFVEVKTRSSHAVEPAEAAVDPEKRTMLRRMAREYLRLLEEPETIPVRFDVVSVYCEGDAAPQIELFRGAFGLQ